jgi:hypothetical protein
MKVLLLGEFSGVHVNLAAGLKEMGVEAVVMSQGDGPKEFRHDIRIPDGKFERVRSYFDLIRNIDQYDLVQSISDGALSSRPSLTGIVMRAISKKVPYYYMAAGDDYQYWTVGRERLEIPLFDELEKAGKSAKTSLADKLRNKVFLHYSTGIIGFNEYYEAYRDHPKCKGIVTLPLEIDRNNVGPDWQAQKLRMFHGVQRGREADKGSFYILEAMKRLKKKYPRDVETVYTTSLPIREYQKAKGPCHILVDQTNGISYGMNALLGLAEGRVVCAGTQDKSYYDRWLSLLGIETYPPVIPLKPDTDFIFDQLERAIRDRSALERMSREGIEFVKRHHDCRIVARQFLNIWESQG